MSAAQVLAPLAGRLLEASAVGGVLALLAWSACRLVPGLPPALRCWLWWGLALKLLLGLTPLPAPGIPLLPGPGAEAAKTVMAPASNALDGSPAVHGELASQPVPRRSPAPGRRAEGSFPWPLALVAFWLAGVAVELARGAVALRRTRRVVRAAAQPSDPGLIATFEALRHRLGAPRAELRLSHQVATPQVVGVVRPLVLLPAGMPDRLAGDELAMALGHELLHVRRGDLVLGLVPALARCAFFFHPLVRLAAREHAQAREEACDAAVVASLAPSPRAYGRLLLDLALGCGAPLRAAAAVVSHRTLQRRLQMLLHPARSWRPAWAWSLALVGVGLLVPLRLTARAGAPPPASPAGLAVVAPRAAPADRTQESYRAALAARDPMPRLGEEERLHRGEGTSFIYFRGPDQTTMSGDIADIARARRYQHGDEPMIWFRRDGAEWVIDDRALLDRVDELWDPMRRLGAQQAELGTSQAYLGAQQAALGSSQAELGQQQAALAAKQAELGAQMARLAAEVASLSARHYRAGEDERATLEEQGRELERRHREMDDGVEELSRQQEELGRQQAALGEQQSALGDRQGALGDQQSALGDQQQRASEEAHRQLEKLLDEAIRSGKARRID